LLLNVAGGSKAGEPKERKKQSDERRLMYKQRTPILYKKVMEKGR